MSFDPRITACPLEQLRRPDPRMQRRLMYTLLYKRLITTMLATIGVGLGWLPATLAHPGRHLGLKISINDEEVAYEILLSAELRNMVVLNDYSSFRFSQSDNRFHFLDPEEAVLTRIAFDEFFQNSNPVTVDGVVVKSILKELEFVPYLLPGVSEDPLAYPPDALVRLVYPLKGRPKQVLMVWELYAQDASRAAFGLDPTVEVVAELDAYNQNKVVVFSAQEPEVIWHAGDTPTTPPVSPLVVMAEPPTIAIPLLSLCIVFVWVIGLLALRFSRIQRTFRLRTLGLSVVLIGGAVLARDTLVVQMTAPWESAVRLPGQQQAADLFASLQRNVYRAFDYKSESDIYDVLAQSVAGELLDLVYNEVYQSLILRDQGGAIARVQSVDVLSAVRESAGVLPDSGVAAFQVRGCWQVRGAVYHWGHVHARTNQYKALYTIAQCAGSWKITGVQDVEQQRIVKEGDDPPVSPRGRPATPY
jgi:hypothetical protein